jgi:hypothetical protein
MPFSYLAYAAYPAWGLQVCAALAVPSAHDTITVGCGAIAESTAQASSPNALLTCNLLAKVWREPIFGPWAPSQGGVMERIDLTRRPEGTQNFDENRGNSFGNDGPRNRRRA